MRLDALRTFYRGTRVVVTGHTGFKGAWLTLALAELGADVTGIALPPDPTGIYVLGGVGRRVRSFEVDIRDHAQVAQVLRQQRPKVVFHLAAQSLVPRSFKDPIETYDVNVIGTAAVLSACDANPDIRAVVVATSDKVYENRLEHRPFVETDRLGAGDPYSTSKAATELVVDSWRHSFRQPGQAGPTLATVRAGNVIGGGDQAADRVVPDVFRALAKDRPVELRNPQSVRPWQHVLEPVRGYLTYAATLAAGVDSGPTPVPLMLNFGPDPICTTTVSELVDRMIQQWGSGSWTCTTDSPGPEADVLLLDSAAAASTLNWRPRLDMDAIVGLTVAWYQCAAAGKGCEALSVQQLIEYLTLADATGDDTGESL